MIIDDKEMNQSLIIETYTPLLQQIAFRLLRCKADAEDVVHETFIRWMESNQQKIRDTKAYLIKSVTNNCFSFLEKSKASRMEPLPKEEHKTFLSFFNELNLSGFDLDLQVKGAMDMVHARLEPLERAIFVLRTAFDVDYGEMSELFDRKAEHCRQLFSRARKKIEMPDLSFKGLGAPIDFIESFKAACHTGNPADLIRNMMESVQKAANRNLSKK